MQDVDRHPWLKSRFGSSLVEVLEIVGHDTRNISSRWRIGRAMTTCISYEGSCHCGALGFSYKTRLATRSWSVRACQCSFCRANNAQWISDPNGSVRFHFSKPNALGLYDFDHRTAEFLFCRVCGVYLAAVHSTHRRDFSAVNLNSLAKVISDLPAAEAVSFSGESREQRIARRQSQWTPVVGQLWDR